MSDDADPECQERYRECLEAKRRQVKNAIAANPAASSRELAKDLPVSKNTVHRTRKSEGVAGATATTPSKRERGFAEDGEK
jgi:hypothetical protein